MNCPRHPAALTSRTTQGHELLRCPECAGLWIPGPSIDLLLGKGEKLKLRSLCSARKSSLTCPVDSETLGETTAAGVTLDFCLACNGLWLDWGELDRLQARVKVKPGPLKSSGGIDPLDVLDTAVTIDVVTFGLLGLLGP